MEALMQQGFKRAHIALHGRYGEDGTVQGALELMELPYTGSGVMASALAMDKWRTKLLWQAAGINTPRHVLLDDQSDFDAVAKELGLPLIVKPSREGSTIGLSKVTAARDLPAAYELAAKHDIHGIGGAVYRRNGVYRCHSWRYALPLVRIQGAGDLYDYEAKYISDNTRYFCPSGLSAAEEQAIQVQALKAHRF